jgi:hypothetical protein
VQAGILKISPFITCARIAEVSKLLELHSQQAWGPLLPPETDIGTLSVSYPMDIRVSVP